MAHRYEHRIDYKRHTLVIYRNDEKHVWRVRFQIDGRRTSTSLSVHTLREAKRAAKILYDTREVDPFPAAGHRWTITDALDAYIAWKESRRASESYLWTIRRAIGIATERCDFVDQITSQVIEQAVVNPTWKPTTVNLHLRYVKSWFAWMIRREMHHGKNPVASIDPIEERTSKTKKRPLTPDELDRLCAVVPRKRALLYRIAARTGLRSGEEGELRKIQWTDVDLAAQTLRCRAEITKNKDEVVLPLNPEALDAFAELQRDHRKGTRVAPVTPAHRTFVSDIERAGIERIDPSGRIVSRHSLRYTFAHYLASNGVSLNEAKFLMRHSTIKLTADLYGALGFGDIKNVYAGFPRSPDAPAESVPEGAVKARRRDAKGAHSVATQPQSAAASKETS